MTNLTEEILEQIDAYKNEGFISEQNVVNAHVQATMRGLLIQEECEKLGIVMEGDIIPERNDEHILKYILLFIPRLIINILNKLYQWVVDLLHPGDVKAREEKARMELESLDIETAKLVMTDVCETITGVIKIKVKGSPCKLNFADKRYFLSWRILSMEDVIETLNGYRDFFSSYTDTMYGLIQKKTFDMEDVLNKLNIATDFITKQNAEYSTVADRTVELSEVPQNVETFKEQVIPLVGEIKAQMNELSKLNVYIEQFTANLPPVNVTYGRKIMALLDNVHTSFSMFCSVIESDIISAQCACSHLKTAQDKAIERITATREAQGIPVKKDDLKKRGVID
jgi:hypothetical protein